MVKDGSFQKPTRRVKSPPVSKTSSSDVELPNNSQFKDSSSDTIKYSGQHDFNWMEKMAECPVYHPSKQEFEDPLSYVAKIAPQASKYGICKIIPPLIPSIPAGVVLMKELKGFKFTTKVQPLRVPQWNHLDKGKFFVRGRNYSIRDFEKMANKATGRRYQISGCLPSSYLEMEFWSEMLQKKKGSVEYGINVDGSAFSSSPHDPLSTSKWNLKTFSQQPKSAFRLLETPIPGVSEPMLYIGMQFSMFAWHVEDHYLYSINYHHCGAPKTWYGVPGSSALQFEKVVLQNIYNQEILTMDGEDGAFDLLFEKTTMFSPEILVSNEVPVYRAVQMPGEFVITFPQAYHAGFSHGFNCGEAVNFAIGDWFYFGAAAITRYALLRRMPIIPYEQLLCREAMLLASHHNNLLDKDSSVFFLKVSFVCLLRFHHLVRWCCLKEFNKSSAAFLQRRNNIDIIHMERSEGSTFCSLCKRECYIAYVVCECHGGGGDPICIFHEEEIRKCVCGKEGLLRMHVREDILEMESVAKMFEDEEEEAHEKVEMQLKSCDSYLSWIQNLKSHDDEYIPYSEPEARLGRLRRSN